MIGDAEFDDFETQVVHHKPISLETLLRRTQFSRRELQTMYRGFKQDCPTGLLDEDTFKEIYSKFFPQGDASTYAQYVFRTFDKDRTGSLTFEQFVMNLSVLVHGDNIEKLKWAFKLYDIDNNGSISQNEMLKVVNSIYALMGNHTNPPIEHNTTQKHVDEVFKRFDLNSDGLISEDEFLQVCKDDPNIFEAISYLYTVF